VPFGGVEALLIGWLKTQLPSVRFLTDTPADLATAVPVVQVVRVGGPSDDDDPSFQSPTVSVDCFAVDRVAATLLAQQVDDALRKALPGAITGGATVTKVQTISGAAWRPWDDLKVRRMGATYVLHLKTA
jgi:hypothetical protein